MTEKIVSNQSALQLNWPGLAVAAAAAAECCSSSDPASNGQSETKPLPNLTKELALYFEPNLSTSCTPQIGNNVFKAFCFPYEYQLEFVAVDGV